jgi:hypothetical protein
VPEVSLDRFPGVSTEVGRVVARALAAKPDDRYPTALAMRQDLGKCIDALGTAMSNDDVGERMTSIFAKERAETAALIERRLGEIERGSHSGDVAKSLAPAARPPRIADRTPSGGTYWSGKAGDDAASTGDVQGARSDVRPSPSSSRRRAVAAVVVVAAVAFFAVVSVTGSLRSVRRSGSEGDPRPVRASAAAPVRGDSTRGASGDSAGASGAKSIAVDSPQSSEAPFAPGASAHAAIPPARSVFDGGKARLLDAGALSGATPSAPRRPAPSPTIDPLGDRK